MNSKRWHHLKKVFGHHGKATESNGEQAEEGKTQGEKKKESKEEKQNRLARQAKAKAECLERTAPAVRNELRQ
jgi:hypothetical protein